MAASWAQLTFSLQILQSSERSDMISHWSEPLDSLLWLAAAGECEALETGADHRLHAAHQM